MTEPTKTVPPKRNRRWFQFSLRSLFVFTTIIAFASAWAAHKIEQVAREREATRHFSALGALIEISQPPLLFKLWPFDEQAVTTGVLVGSKWYYLTIGTSRFAESMKPQVRQPTVSDLRRLKDLPGLDTLRITSRFVTDQGIEELVSIKSLRTLEIRAPLISDSSVQQLARMDKLADLALIGTAMTPDGIAKLRWLLPHCRVSTCEVSETLTSAADVGD